MADLLDDAKDLGEDQERCRDVNHGVVIHSVEEKVSTDTKKALDVADLSVITRHY